MDNISSTSENVTLRASVLCPLDGDECGAYCCDTDIEYDSESETIDVICDNNAGDHGPQYRRKTHSVKLNENSNGAERTLIRERLNAIVPNEASVQAGDADLSVCGEKSKTKLDQRCDATTGVPEANAGCICIRLRFSCNLKLLILLMLFSGGGMLYQNLVVAYCTPHMRSVEAGLYNMLRDSGNTSSPQCWTLLPDRENGCQQLLALSLMPEPIDLK
ncbi:hypothetical protein EVAR_11697_1 [Eumeta japonica]|uniref:Uncharacterized protein n=1 Tax=Eumeta variegata TaxID=151549 RepID=A0A4C1U4N4_EUMVA|nr:hypothetical protein EVAR_11697_1 [Eumeta japonica]